MPSAITGPFHRLSRCGPSIHCWFIGGVCLLGEMPCRGSLLWNVGHSGFGGAVGGLTAVVKE